MTYKELTEIIQSYNIPEDVTLKSDSGWEIDATDMDGVFYDQIENEMVFTESMGDYRYLYNKIPWIKLESWKMKAKEAYAYYEEEATYIESYQVNGIYVVHGELFIYGFDQSFKKLWSFSGRDIFVAQDGSPAVKFKDDHIEVTDWLGYRYEIDFTGKSCDVTAGRGEVSWLGFTSGEVELSCMSEAEAELLLDVCRKNGIGCAHVVASDYKKEPFWYVSDGELVTTCYTLEKDSICACFSFSDYILEHT